jgi:DNA-directed RNA polymerase specialized sigma24 family protein
MDLTDSAQRISRIDTLWSVVVQANGCDARRAEAQRQLLARYGSAVRRYLLAATRSADAADELFQEFALRFLRGDMRGATPTRGRFRNFLKGVLFHLAADFHNNKKRLPLLSPDHPEPAAPPSIAEQDEAFLTAWRDQLLARSWDALQSADKASGKPYFMVLRFRAEHPGATSEEMAQWLGREIGKAVSAASLRQTLHRARECFADLLLNEIAQALDDPTDEMLEAELIELSLLDHCLSALRRRGATARGGS